MTQLIDIKTSKKAYTTKLYQFQLNGISANFPYVKRGDKNIICLSCMFGCSVGCAFCLSGKNYYGKIPHHNILEIIVVAVPGKSGHTLCIYARDGEKVKQLGLINEFSVRASSANPAATMDAFFDSLPEGSSKEVIESRQRSIDLLTKAGCRVRHLEREDKE